MSLYVKRMGSANYQGVINAGYYSSGSWEIRMGSESGRMIGGGVNTVTSDLTWEYIGYLPSLNSWNHIAFTYDG